MADESAPPPLVEGTAPADSQPPAEQVTIALGPDLAIYPSELRPAETTQAAPAAPEAPSPEPPEPLEPAAGPASPEGAPQGSRRRANEDAYQRGLSEGRAAYEREQEQKRQADLVLQTQREANARVEQLFGELASSDYATQDRARRNILQMYSGNQQAQALMHTTRLQILQEMAADFSKLSELDGLSDTDYQSLHTAPSAAELARRAFDLGKTSGTKARDEQVTKLEAEVEGLRGRLVGSRSTPVAHNGSGAIDAIMSIEQYQALPPKEAAKLSPSQVDAMTRQWAADAARNNR